MGTTKIPQQTTKAKEKKEVKEESEVKVPKIKIKISMLYNLRRNYRNLQTTKRSKNKSANILQEQTIYRRRKRTTIY